MMVHNNGGLMIDANLNGQKMAESAKKWLKWWENGQKGGKLAKMVENWPKWWKNGRNGQNGHKIAKMAKNGQCGQ